MATVIRCILIRLFRIGHRISSAQSSALPRRQNDDISRYASVRAHQLSTLSRVVHVYVVHTRWRNTPTWVSFARSFARPFSSLFSVFNFYFYSTFPRSSLSYDPPFLFHLSFFFFPLSLCIFSFLVLLPPLSLSLFLRRIVRSRSLSSRLDANTMMFLSNLAGTAISTVENSGYVYLFYATKKISALETLFFFIYSPRYI